MHDQNLLKSISSGFAWHFAERILAQLVSTIVSIVLARMISPDNYGIISLVLVFINITYVFVSGGISDALIQDQNADEDDFSTVLFLNIGVSLVIYFILFVSAPFWAEFYNNRQITIVLRVISLKIVISSVNALQHTYCSKHMMFKKFFISTFGGTVLSGIVGIIMAMNGLGVWALVAQYLVNSFTDTAVLAFTIPWKPRLYFDFKAAKRYYSSGLKLMMANLTSAVYNELRSLVIGKIYSPANLAYYNKGEQFPKLIINNVQNTICSVMFPALAKKNDNVNEIKHLIRRTMQVSSFIIFPLMCGMGAISENFVRLLLTDKWLPCVPFMQIACTYYAFNVVNAANLQAITAMGKNGEILQLEVVKKGIAICVLLLVMHKGVIWISISNILVAILSYYFNSKPNIRYLNYGRKEQILDIAPSLLSAVAMALIVGCVPIIGNSLAITLLLQVVLGLILYMILSFVINRETLMFLLKLINLER